MANSVWQATIQNAAGDIVPGAEITVIDEGTGVNAVIFSSKAGAALTNPFNADAGGFAQFYSGPGEYRITAFDIGTGLTQTFDNWRLGDAGARDVGLNTGDVLSPEGAGLDGGETNYTSGNLNPNVFDADTVGDRVASGGGITSGVATFLLATSLDSAASSITVVGTYNVTTLFGAIVSGGAGVTPTLSSASSSKATNIIVSGLSGLTDNTPLFLKAVSASSKITVNS